MKHDSRSRGFTGTTARHGFTAFAAVAVTLAAMNHSRPQAPLLMPTVQSLEQLARIVTLKVHLADTLAVDARDGIDSVRAAWIIKGDALIGIDVARASIEDIDSERRTAVIRLPQPEVMSPRVDHDRTRTVNMRTGWWTSGDYMALISDRAMLRAQQRITEQAGSAEHIDMAREQAARIITGFYEIIGWTVGIVWSDNRRDSKGS